MSISNFNSARNQKNLGFYVRTPKYGRTGLYQVQDIMKMVNQGVSNRVEEVMNAKAVMAGFPATNWYIRGQELLIGLWTK